MQTFLPYPDFRESARVLDQGRLGKQRVEALQVLRAIVLPAYGWQSHPAMRMWHGYVPALTRYSLDMVDTWTARGHADTTRAQIAEFAPEVDGASLDRLAVPSWLGAEAFHLSHRSNLIRKAPEFYSPLFPGVSGDLPYVWPGPDEPAATATNATKGDTDARMLPILRPVSDEQLDEWRTTGRITMAESSPRGKTSRAWLSQLDDFAALGTGARFAALHADGNTLELGTVLGPVSAGLSDGVQGLQHRAEFDGTLPRSAFGYPALLQDPRSLFRVPAP